MAAVRHPNVVGLLSYGRAAHVNYLVTDWGGGPSLAAMIAESDRAGPPADFARARRWLVDAARGLGAIHAAGLVHRDVKPANILIGPDGRAVLVDLGIARAFDATETALTSTGLAPGTFAYMAPEQLTSPCSVDARADLFALGVTFYELLTGSLPAGSWRPASEINPTVPARFDAILARLLRPRPEDRYPDAGTLIRACSGPRAPGSTAAPRRRGPPMGGAVPIDPGGGPSGPPAVALTDPSDSGRGLPSDRPARRAEAAAIAARDVVAAAIEAAARRSGAAGGRSEPDEGRDRGEGWTPGTAPWPELNPTGRGARRGRPPAPWRDPAIGKALRVGARNGAIWGTTLVLMPAGPIFVVLAFAGPSPSGPALAAHRESLGPSFLIWTASVSALGAIAGMICAVARATEGEAMAPVGFRKVVGRIFAPVGAAWTAGRQSFSETRPTPARGPAGAERDGRSRARDPIAKPTPPVDASKKKASPFGHMITAEILSLL